jgi:hypothetical protein
MKPRGRFKSGKEQMRIRYFSVQYFKYLWPVQLRPPWLAVAVRACSVEEETPQNAALAWQLSA